MRASVHRIEVCQEEVGRYGPVEYVMKIWFQAPYEDVGDIANAARDFFCGESGLPEPMEEEPVYEVD